MSNPDGTQGENNPNSSNTHGLIFSMNSLSEILILRREVKYSIAIAIVIVIAGKERGKRLEGKEKKVVEWEKFGVP